ncbi:MAG: sulfite exporter TauE/SafE family protein [Candidatus Levybacteria bacterium]|nr:sulfite exporter TauE/SafE family protein [Candidatus Levybacteria bacterium]
MNLWVIFLTGLTVGGLTCLAVQGGLLASVITAREKEEVQKGINKKNATLPTLSFLVTKFIAYTLLGFVLGAFGGAIGISQTAQIIMQLVAGLYMIAVALNLLNIHPIFRYAIIQPPRFLLKKLKNQSRSKELFAPALLGAMTIFIPCGTTLAMEALAISSGSPLLGAAIMAAFILGTTPVFFGVGFLTSILGDNFRTRFLKIAAIGVLYLGITSINGAFIASGFPFNSQNLSIYFNSLGKQKSVVDTNNNKVSQMHEIYVYGSGYSPNHLTVKRGLPVSITLIGKDAYSCASAFRIPSLGISKNLGPNEKYTFSFTPDKAGQIIFTCSMGMYRGVIEVI